MADGVPQNEITVCSFSQEAFIALAHNEAHGKVPDQVSYLARYCDKLGARTMVIESLYVDRHYTDEYAHYYSRMLLPPKSTVRRVHFFSRELDAAKWTDFLARALTSPSAKAAVEQELEKGATEQIHGYLGFTSLRPVPVIPIGRTILGRLSDGAGTPRDIWAVNKHYAHIGNIRLGVEGLAFQQQDAAVGACATASLWSALVQVARLDGMRAPTPAEISAAAVGIPRGKGLPPSNGLTVDQLCDATRAFGFHPEVVQVSDRPEIAVLAMHTYLLSGIPFVIVLHDPDGDRAVTAVGFQLTSDHPLLQTSIPARSARMTKLYVHDDRLGPYARAFITPYANGPDYQYLAFEIDFDGAESEQWLIDSIVAPIYPKLRLPVGSLIALADYKTSMVENIVGTDDAFRLRVDLRYERAGSYLGKLSGRIVDAGIAAAFTQRVSLSRWCAVVRWYLDDRELLEFVYDTTDVVRSVEVASRELLRGVVALHPDYAVRVRSVADALLVPGA